MSGEMMIRAVGLEKRFVLHTQGGAEIPVFSGLDFTVGAGECVALDGISGAGKSTLLRALYANYKLDRGQVMVRHRGDWVDMASALPREVLDVRQHTIGYVSQFLRVIPRVPTLDIVSEPLRRAGTSADEARATAEALLTRLRIPERLWSIAPATFSGGEQQRVNLARGFIAGRPIMLLDEPTAALDADNRKTVIDLIGEAKARGAAIVGIFHDAEVRGAVADRLFRVEAFKAAA